MRLKASPDGDEMREPSGEIKFPNWRQFYGKDRPPAGATLFDPRSVADEVRSYIAEYPEENHYPVLLPPHRGRGLRSEPGSPLLGVGRLAAPAHDGPRIGLFVTPPF